MSSWVYLFRAIFLNVLVCITIFPVDGAEQGKTLLALGDSLTAGQLPGYLFFTDQGWVNTLYTHLESTYGFDTLVNAGCPGDTTASFLDSNYSNHTECPIGNGDDDSSNLWIAPPSWCYSELCSETIFPKGLEGESQMLAAEQYLADHLEEVGLIVLAIGSNDLNACNPTNANTCVPAAFQQISTNLAEILTRLQTLAPNVPIIGLRYYNPLVAWYLPGGDATIATLYEAVLDSFRDLLDEIYGSFSNVFVADGYGAINGYDTSGNPRQDVLHVCQYTGMCMEIDGEYQLSNQSDTHATAMGYIQLGDAFVSIVEDERLLLDATTTEESNDDDEGETETSLEDAAGSTRMILSFYAILGLGLALY